jgi:hypothetical protein
MAKRPLTDPRQLFRGKRKVRAFPSRPRGKADERVEITLQVPRAVFDAINAQGPVGVQRIADALSEVARLRPRRR